MLRQIVIFCYFYYIVYGLRWTRSGIPNTLKILHLNSSTRNIKLDVSYESQIIIIRDVQQWNFSLSFDCFIKGYNNNAYFLYSFCKNDACVMIKDKIESQHFSDFDIEGDIQTMSGSRKGFQITMRIPNKYVDVSGNYFCKVDNDKMVLRSNNIELRDTFFWERKMFTKVESSYKSNIQSISMESLPNIFNCSDGNSKLNDLMPKWSNFQFRSRVSWSVCPVLKDYIKLRPEERMSPEKCLTYTGSKCSNKLDEKICPRDLSKMEGWKYNINERGDLIFVDLPQQNSNTGITYVLMCYTKDSEGELQSISYFYNKKNDIDFISGITIDNTQYSGSKPLSPITTLVRNVTIFARQMFPDLILQPVSISALYRSSSTSSYQWFFKGLNLNSNNFITVSKYMVTFEREINSDHSGKYSLEVTDKSEKLIMDVNVKVLGPPMLEDDQCMPPISYIYDGGNISFSCKYKNYPNVMKLLINSQEIQLNDSMSTSQAQLKILYPHLVQLSFYVIVRVLTESSIIITYNAYNLTKTQDQTQYQDHTVTLYVSNEYGMSLKTFSIYVIPMFKTVLNIFPDQDNCTLSCSSSKSHTFRCDANLEGYSNKELIINQYWTFLGFTLKSVNDTSDHMYSQFFQTSLENKKITLLPIISKNPHDKVMKEALANSFLECRIRIQTSSEEGLGFYYDSTLDNAVRNRMISKITLDYVPLSTANLSWIIGVILISIAIVIAIVSIIVCTKQKKKRISRKKRTESKKEMSTREDLLNT